MLRSSAKVARMTVHINPIIKNSPGFFLHKTKENIQQIAVNILKIILIIIVDITQSSNRLLDWSNIWFTAGRSAAAKTFPVAVFTIEILSVS